MDSTKPTVKKVKPYPFPAQLKDMRGTFPGQIVKMANQGLMIEAAGTAVQPGEKVDISFVTPIQNGTVGFTGVVVKVYNQLSGMGATPAMTAANAGAPAGTPGSIHLIEVHYTAVPPDSMNNIMKYLVSAGQAKLR